VKEIEEYICVPKHTFFAPSQHLPNIEQNNTLTLYPLTWAPLRRSSSLFQICLSLWTTQPAKPLHLSTCSAPASPKNLHMRLCKCSSPHAPFQLQLNFYDTSPRCCTISDPEQSLSEKMTHAEQYCTITLT
jgi:hypothetical protein